MRNSSGSTQERLNHGRLAQGLGWFSIGLGLAELAAPGKVAEIAGLRDRSGTRMLLRSYGLRELAAGIGILSNPHPTGWVWSRVAGDAMDLSSLGAALASDRTNRARVAGATAAVLGVTALDILCGAQLHNSSGPYLVRVSETILVNRSPQDCYRFWRDFSNLAKFMYHLESVRILDERRSHWQAKAPAGTTVDWDAELVRDDPGSRISWRSLEGSQIETSGSVHFDPGPAGRGTLVRVELYYAPPGGRAGAQIARLFGKEPGQQVRSDLRRFKQVIETGEVLRSDASVHERMHAAQPPAPEEELVLTGGGLQ